MTATVVVTGGAGAVGSAVCRAFRDEGLRVVSLDVSPAGDADESLEVDIRSEPAIRAAFASLESSSELTTLVNVAGRQLVRPIHEVTVDEWDDLMAVNVRAAFLTTSAARAQLARRGGSIVNVSSVHAVATSPGMAAYAASKAALVGLTRGAALDLAADGIRVNAVLPGAVDTAMLRAGVLERGSADVDGGIASLESLVPLGRIGEPREIADLIVFLAGPKASFITGQVFVVDGGVTTRLASE